MRCWWKIKNNEKVGGYKQVVFAVLITIVKTNKFKLEQSKWAKIMTLC